MKKIMAATLAMVMLVGVLAGCSEKKQEANNYNKEFNAEKMTTLGGQEVSLQDEENAFGDRMLGFAYVDPDAWDTLNADAMCKAVAENSFYMDYLPSQPFEKLDNFDYENASEEEIDKLFEEEYSKAFQFLCIYRVQGDAGEEMQDRFANNVLLGTIGKDNYYLAYNDKMPEGNLTDQDKADINALIGSIEELKQNIILFPAEEFSEEGNFEGTLNEFSALDLNGQTVTQDILKNYDITMVNIWTTWCGFCVEEMPELAELYENLPENVNMITICGDAAEETELAKEIVASANAKFTTLQGNEALERCLLDAVSGFPTTIFVDSEGNVVGAPQVGAPGVSGEIVEGYTALIQDALASVGK
jgi:thiol-disulfide isomerase/thioredoxin